MLGFIESRQRFAGNARQDSIKRFDDRHMLAQFREHSGGFQSDIAAADDNHFVDGRQCCHDLVDVGAGPDGVNIARLASRTIEHARRSAGCPDQLAVAYLVIGGQHDRFCDRIEFRYPATGQQIDIALAPETLGSQQYPLERLFSGEIFLGQGRAFVGRIFLVSDQTDGAFKLLLAQRNGRLRACVTSAHNQNVVKCFHTCPLMPLVGLEGAVSADCIGRASFSVFLASAC